jgi:dimethylamine monooxygenase subunit A
VPDHPLPHPHPAFYFPPRDGRYEVAPGLVRFSKDFGNGEADAHVFQIDSCFESYRRAKLAARSERLGRYFCTANLADEVGGAAARFMTRRLASEHPAWFTLREPDAAGHTTVACALTGDVLTFDTGMRLTSSVHPAAPEPPYACALDALACQVQEDVAIVSGSEGRNWLSAAHVCFPNGWAPEEKIGRDFAALHEPVAGMEFMNARGGEFAGLMLGASGGLLRFAWGVTFDDRLDHHPQSPRSRFDPNRPRAFLRVERQTMWGFPDVNGCLFTIRTYLYDCSSLRRDPATASQLAAAVASMTPESLAYKGLAESHGRLTKWLRNS